MIPATIQTIADGTVVVLTESGERILMVIENQLDRTEGQSVHLVQVPTALGPTFRIVPK